MKAAIRSALVKSVFSPKPIQTQLDFIVEKIVESVSGQKDLKLAFKQQTVELKQQTVELKQQTVELEQQAAESSRQAAESSRQMAESSRQMAGLTQQVDSLSNQVTAQGEKLEVISKQLNRIESNTVSIKEIVISEFTGISEIMKAILTTTGNEMMEDQEVIDTVAEMKGEKPCALVRKSSGKFVAKKRHSITIKKAIDSLGGDLTGTRGAIGNWVSGVMAKIHGVNFHGKYPAASESFITNLVMYHQTERTSNGRQY